MTSSDLIDLIQLNRGDLRNVTGADLELRTFPIQSSQNLSDAAAAAARASFLIPPEFCFLGVMNRAALLKRRPETGGRGMRYIGNGRGEAERNHLWY